MNAISSVSTITLDDQGQAGHIVPTLRALKIIEVIAASEQKMTLSMLCEQLALPKQSVHRLCRSLIEEGYLVAEGRHIRPARRLRSLCSGVLFSSTGHIARHQVLTELMEQTGETVNFVIAESQGMKYLDRVETGWAFRIQLPIGSHVPFHCTASGKMFLASLTSRQRRPLIAGLDLTPKTKNTITDPKQLSREVSKIAKRGYSLDQEELYDNMVAIAVPVFDDKDQFIAALAIHGPKDRLPVELAIERMPLVRKAADQLQTLLFTS